MKTFAYILLVTAIIAVAAPSANAQSTGVRLNIPFAFLAGDTVLPAGAYQFDVELSCNRLAIRSMDGAAGAYLTAHPGNRKGGLHQNAAVFHKYGNTYVLRHLAVAGYYEGRDLGPSKAERELAAKANSRVQLAWVRSPR